MLILCSCCSRAHLPCPCYCAHVDLPCPCSRDHVDSMLIFRTRIPMPMLISHAHVPVPMFIPCSCISHPHVVCVYHMIALVMSSCLTVCRLYPALILKFQ